MGDWTFHTDPLKALQDGDRAPFEAFVRSHARLLVAWFRRQGAGLHGAEDLTQDVFLKLHKTAGRYLAQDRFGAFCLQIARNLWIDDCRRRGVRPAAISLEGRVGEDSASLAETLHPEQIQSGPGGFPPPGRQAVVHEEDEHLRRAILELSPMHREVFDLAMMEGLPYPEISEVLGVPVGTVKSRVFYALRKLRELLGDKGVDPGVDPSVGHWAEQRKASEGGHPQ
ncbi:MAG: RNA polymerase sigma-70 factor (ECF subfamily) [Planctomycetota bacterium]|jgi:RNA polymerase sigma-70 factor (ECF subfamily)